MIGLALAAQASALRASEGVVQAPGEVVSIEEHVDPALQPLTVRERFQATSALRGDVRSAARLTGNQRIQTVSVERHEAEKGAPTDQRRADVVLYNYDTNETITAVVTLGLRPLVEELTVTGDQPPGLGRQEVEEARQLALADPRVQAGLSAAGLTGRESSLVITHIRVQAAAPGDPCSTDRCVALFFNTPAAVLDVEPIVNLTTRAVEVQ